MILRILYTWTFQIKKTVTLSFLRLAHTCLCAVTITNVFDASVKRPCPLDLLLNCFSWNDLFTCGQFWVQVPLLPVEEKNHPIPPHLMSSTHFHRYMKVHTSYTHIFFWILPVSKVTPSTLPSRIHWCPLFQLWFWVRFHSIPMVSVTIIPSRSSSTAKRIWKNNNLQEANGFAMKTRNRGHETIQPMIPVWKKKGAPLACLCISLVWKTWCDCCT